MSVSSIASAFCQTTTMGMLDCDDPLQSITPICVAMIAVSAVAITRADFIYDGCRRLYVTLDRKSGLLAIVHQKFLENPLWGKSPEAEQYLERAIREGKMSVYRYLLFNSNVKASDNCLILALEHRRDHIIPRLLHSCSTAAVDGDGNTPLMIAIQKGLPHVARKILSAHAHSQKHLLRDPDQKMINNQNKLGYTALHFAAQEHANLVRELVQAGADPTITCEGGETPLHLAADQDNAESVRILVEQGADVNARDDEGNTPLHKTVNYQGARLKAAKALLESSTIDPNIYNEEGVMPLHDACAMTDAKDDIALLLLRSGKCDVIAKTKDEDSSTPVEIVAGLKGRGQQILIELVKQGAGVLGKGLFEVGSEEALIELAREIREVESLSRISIKGLSLPQAAVAYQMGRLRSVLASKGVTFNGDPGGRVREILLSQIAEALRVIYDKVPVKVTEVRRLLEDIESKREARESKEESLESKRSDIESTPEVREFKRSVDEQRQPELYGFIQDWITAYLARCQRHDQLRKNGKGSEVFMLVTDGMGVPPLLKEILPERLMKFDLAQLKEMPLPTQFAMVPETEVSLEDIQPYLPMLKQYLDVAVPSWV